MDIYCPACGKKGRIEDGKIPHSGIFARCPGCKNRLWVHKSDGVSLAGEPSSARPAPGEGQPGSEPPKNTQPAQPGPPAAPPAAAPPATASETPATSYRPPEPETRAQDAPASPAGFEISPVTPHQPQPDPSVHQEMPAHGVLCGICGNVYPQSDMVRFGDTAVCASCKPQYVQMMKSGISRPGMFTYGGFWIRFAAKIIDGLILGIAQGILIVPLYVFIFRNAGTSSGPELMATFATANIFINILSIALGAAYTTLFIGKYRATPGKMAFGLKVVLPDGGRVSYWRAFGRHFAEMVSAFTLFIGYIMAGFDSQKRSLHDRICATRVIRN